MNQPIVPFWRWNRRVSFRTMTPAETPSFKTPIHVRTLQRLQGIPISFIARRRAAKARRDALKAAVKRAAARQSIRQAVLSTLVRSATSASPR